MEDKKSHFIVYKDESEKTEIIKKNVIKMLSNRIYIDSKKNKQSLLDYDATMKKLSDDGNNVFTFEVNNGDKYALKIIYQKITNTGKQSLISDFINEYSDHKNIIVAKEFNTKIIQFVSNKSTQIFSESTLLSDLISHELQPQFIILTPDEIQTVMAEYNINIYSMKKIFKSDPVTKYYGLKKGNVLKIIRKSPISGLQIDYRIVG